MGGRTRGRAGGGAQNYFSIAGPSAVSYGPSLFALLGLQFRFSNLDRVSPMPNHRTCLVNAFYFGLVNF